MDKANRFRFRIRELREENGYKSQQAFADDFGTVQSTVGGWEAGKREPSFDTVIRLAQFFGTTIDDLLCGQGNQEFDYTWNWDGNNLKSLREQGGYSCADVAEMLGNSLKIYNQIEQSSVCPSIPLLCRIAISLQTSVDTLLGIEVVETSNDASIKYGINKLANIFMHVNADGRKQILKQAEYALRDENLILPKKSPQAEHPKFSASGE